MGVKPIPALTGIRGAAALLVVLLHLPVAGRLPVIRNGGYGVDLFFLLSGFILFHVHAVEFQRPSWMAAKRFFILRFLRVYPLHFAALTAIVALVLLFPAYPQWVRANVATQENAFSLAGFVQTLTLTNRIGLPDFGTWNGPSWSLSSEAFAYMMFPLLAVICLRTRRSVECIIFVVVSLCMYVVASLTGHHGVTRVLLTFPAGMALARLTHVSPPSDRSARRIAAAATLLVVVTLSIDKFSPLSVFAFAMLIFGLSGNSGVVAKALSSRSMMFLGTISFSLYLTHQAMFMFLSWATHEKISPIAMVLIAIGVASITYRLVEAPSHRYGRHVAKRQAASVQSIAEAVT